VARKLVAPHIKAKVRTEAGGFEIAGPFPGTLVYLLSGVAKRSERERVLREMRETHQRLCEAEDQRLREQMPINDLFPETK
jgi:hypothetical protein